METKTRKPKKAKLSKTLPTIRQELEDIRKEHEELLRDCEDYRLR